MLSYRKDSATGHKLALYWNKNPVPKEKYEKYWLKEVARLKAIIVEEEKKTDAIIKCADAIINRARSKGSLGIII